MESEADCNLRFEISKLVKTFKIPRCLPFQDYQPRQERYTPPLSHFSNNLLKISRSSIFFSFFCIYADADAEDADDGADDEGADDDADDDGAHVEGADANATTHVGAHPLPLDVLTRFLTLVLQSMNPVHMINCPIPHHV